MLCYVYEDTQTTAYMKYVDNSKFWLLKMLLQMNSNSLIIKQNKNKQIYMHGIHHWRILSSSYRKLAWMEFELTTTEFHSDALTNWTIRPWERQLCTATPISSFVQCQISFRLLPSSVATFILDINIIGEMTSQFYIPWVSCHCINQAY